jgi:hypothetical protein
MLSPILQREVVQPRGTCSHQTTDKGKQRAWQVSPYPFRRAEKSGTVVFDSGDAPRKFCEAKLVSL